MTAPVADMTELVDAQIDRVDLVGKAANGTRFLMRKAAAADGRLTQPLVPAGMVRDLLAKAQEANPVTTPTDDVTKTDNVTPTPTVDLVPDAPGGTTANSLPGSPDWETLDGDTAMAAVATLGRVKAALGWLADREAQEAVTGDADDAANAYDLDDMAAQLDWMIGRLAGFAVGEHMEADPDLAPVGKAVADAAAPLAVLEGLAPLRKAGRTLSAANETAIRGAVESLTKVLDSLPQAPAADDAAVTKTEETPTVTTSAPAAVAEPVDVFTKALAALPTLDAADVASALLAGGRTQDVAKAAGDPQLAVFDASGTLIGTVDPGKLSPIATSPAAAEPAAEGTPAEEAAETPAQEAAEPADPADGAVIPGTDTVQAPAPAPAAPAAGDPKTPAVTKTADTATLEELRTQATEGLRKSTELEAVVKALQEQVRKMGALPDDRNSPVLNGATGAPGVMARDGSNTDQTADLRKAIAAETDPEKKLALQKSAFFAEVASRFTR